MKSHYYKLFASDEKSLILAMDHGGGGVFPFDNPGELIERAVGAGVDGVLTTYGVIKSFRKQIGKVGTFLRVDAYGSALNPELFREEPAAKWNVEDIVQMGVDGVMCFGFIGMENKNGKNYDAMAMKLMAKIACDCDRYGLISGAEVLPNGFSEDPTDRTLEKMKIACRAAAESGIDVVKTAFVPPVEEYKKIVNNCYVPILALGGSNQGPRALLEQCKNAIDSGCKGLAVGRNIWGSKDIEGTVRALVKIVHENASVDEALTEIKEQA